MEKFLNMLARTGTMYFTNFQFNSCYINVKTKFSATSQNLDSTPVPEKPFRFHSVKYTCLSTGLK